MNRLGCAILAALALIVAGFLLLQGEGARKPVSTPPPPKVAVPKAAAELTPSGLVIPVAGVKASALVDTWGDARSQGRKHEAIDIMAPRGTPVVSAMPGTVEKLFESKQGGTTAYVRSDNGRWVAYYAHLDAYAHGLAEGKHLARGDPIGVVGDTGNAPPGVTHLHFELHRMKPGEGWWQGEPVNPYPVLTGR